MNTSDLLEQLLQAGQAGAAQRGGAGMASQDPLGGLGGLLGGLMGGGGGGGNAGLGGLLGGILGGGSGGGMGGSAIGANPMGGGRSGGMNYAALASLGMMAFQAYQSWQRQQPSAPQQAISTVDQLEGSEADEHSLAILRALIAAAKADGRIDEQEKQTIYAEISRHTDDPQLQEWLDQEVGRPLDAAEVAQSASNPGMAAEMYLASVMLVDDQQAAERTYLDELAYQLRLDPNLQAQLEQQARGNA